MQTNGQSDSSTPRKKLFAPLLVASDRGGFTLVELLIVVSIVSILAVTAGASYTRFREHARIIRCTGEIRGLEREVTAWLTEKATLPASLADLGRGALRDPWGNNYVYAAPTERTDVGLPINADFDLFSKGFNGGYVPSISEAVSEDDIIRGRDGAYAGLAILY